MSDTGWISGEVSILANLAESLLSIQELVTGAAYLMGISFAIKALYSLRVYGESKTQMSSHSSIKEPLVYLFVAAMLIYFPTGFEVLMNTSFGYSEVLAYAPIDSGSPLLSSLFGADSAVGQYLALLIQVVGLFAFVRGWIMIARSAAQGQPPGGTGKGLMHVFGGILAMNIIGTLQMINNTLYGG